MTDRNDLFELAKQKQKHCIVVRQCRRRIFMFDRHAFQFSSRLFPLLNCTVPIEHTVSKTIRLCFIALIDRVRTTRRMFWSEHISFKNRERKTTNHKRTTEGARAVCAEQNIQHTYNMYVPIRACCSSLVCAVWCIVEELNERHLCFLEFRCHIVLYARCVETEQDGITCCAPTLGTFSVSVAHSTFNGRLVHV